MIDTAVGYLRETFTLTWIIQSAVYTIIGSIIFRLWRAVLTWPRNRRREGAFWGLSVVTLFFLFFIVGQMRSEGTKPPALPDLNLEVPPLFGDITAKDERVAYVSLMVRIRNRGSPPALRGIC